MWRSRQLASVDSTISAPSSLRAYSTSGSGPSSSSSVRASADHVVELRRLAKLTFQTYRTAQVPPTAYPRQPSAYPASRPSCRVKSLLPNANATLLSETATSRTVRSAACTSWPQRPRIVARNGFHASCSRLTADCIQAGPVRPVLQLARLDAFACTGCAPCAALAGCIGTPSPVTPPAAARLAAPPVAPLGPVRRGRSQSTPVPAVSCG